MNKKILLFDIDYTLLNTTKLRELIVDALASHVSQVDFKLVDDIYYEIRQQGAFDPKLFAQLFKNRHEAAVAEEEIERLWFDDQIIQQALYPEALSVLQQLQKREDIELGIFSSGKTEFQLQKIASLSDLLTERHIHIAEFKEETLPELMHEYEKEDVVMIDDLVTVLQKAKSFKQNLFTIWMKRGKYALLADTSLAFEPDATVTTLSQIPDILGDAYI